MIDARTMNGVITAYGARMIDAGIAQHLVIGDVAMEVRNSRDRRLETLRIVVDDDHLMAGCHQVLRG